MLSGKVAGETRPDAKQIFRRLISRPAIVLSTHHPMFAELPKKRRRTELPVPYSGSGSAIGWHNSTLKIDVRVRMRSASGFCTSARCLQCASSSLKGKSDASSINPARRVPHSSTARNSYRRRCDPWFLGSGGSPVARLEVWPPRRRPMARCLCWSPLCVAQFMTTDGAVTKIKMTQYGHDDSHPRVREAGSQHPDGFRLRQSLCSRRR
jgi:hypothetical protein